MKIIVLVKQVPNTTEVKLDPKTGNLIREGIESIINPDDRHALEAAAHLKETAKAKVTVLSMGPPQAIDAVSEAMGMGADEGLAQADEIRQVPPVQAELVRVGASVRPHRHRFTAPDQLRAARAEPLPAAEGQLRGTAVGSAVPAFHRLDAPAVGKRLFEGRQRVRPGQG